MSMYLEDIITSEVRVRLLAALFTEVNKNLYVRELTRKVGTEVNAIRRELKRFTKAGLLRKEQRGNRLYYIVRKDYVYYSELLSMVAKTTGIGNLLIQNASSLGKIKLAILSAEFAEGRISKSDELDLLVVGDINLDALETQVREASRNLGRDINYTVLSENDFNVQKARKESFLISFMIAPNILIMGEADKLLSL